MKFNNKLQFRYVTDIRKEKTVGNVPVIVKTKAVHSTVSSKSKGTGIHVVKHKNRNVNTSNQCEFSLAEISRIDLFILILHRLAVKSKILSTKLSNSHSDECANNGVFSEEEIKKIVIISFRVYDNLVKHHGIKGGSKLWKEFRNYTLRQARGQPHGLISVSTSTGKKDKVISKFQKLRPFIFASRDGCEYSYQILNSILYSSRMDQRLPNTNKYSLKDVQYSFVVNPAILNKYRMWVRRKVTSFWQIPKIPFGKFIFDFPLTSSSPGTGKNGESLDAQAFSLRNSKLYNAFRNACAFFKDADLADYVAAISKRYAEQNPQAKSEPIRRITRISDSDVKDRVIAIMDAYSQLIGGRVQSMLYSFMKMNQMSHTDVFDHATGAYNVVFRNAPNSLFKSPGTDYTLKCIDLDAWTWKFSKEPQMVFLSEVFGQGISDPFTALFLKCEWKTDPSKTGFESVIAKTGQAMGGKASFVLATVTSISIMQAASEGVFDEFRDAASIELLHKDGIFETTSECLFKETGDDFVMYDHYDRMEEALVMFGNTINHNKSVTSADYPSGEINSFTEYLSRTSLNDKDCSRISLRLCRLAMEHFTYAPQLIRHMAERSEVTISKDDFRAIWTKTRDGLQKEKTDKCGRKWTDNLMTILTLENSSTLSYGTLCELSLIDDTISQKYIETFQVRKCLFLAQEILAKIKETSFAQDKSAKLIRTARAAEVRIVTCAENHVTPLDLFWVDHLKRTDDILKDIKSFVFDKVLAKGPTKSGPKLNIFLSLGFKVPRFINKENLEEAILDMSDYNDSSMRTEEFVNLLTKNANLVDGSYPSISDRSAKFKNISSLIIRVFHSEKIASFERLDSECEILYKEDNRSVVTKSTDTSVG